MMDNEKSTTIKTQGSTNEQEEQLGGTTNLSLDQLKEEGGIASSVGDNPDGFTDQDDFNEIRVPDDWMNPTSKNTSKVTNRRMIRRLVINTFRPTMPTVWLKKTSVA
jgi:hypothetical protein